jgi:hypothetical protein
VTGSTLLASEWRDGGLFIATVRPPGGWTVTYAWRRDTGWRRLDWWCSDQPNRPAGADEIPAEVRAAFRLAAADGHAERQ